MLLYAILMHQGRLLSIPPTRHFLSTVQISLPTIFCRIISSQPAVSNSSLEFKRANMAFEVRLRLAGGDWDTGFVPEFGRRAVTVDGERYADGGGDSGRSNILSGIWILSSPLALDESTMKVGFQASGASVMNSSAASTRAGNSSSFFTRLLEKSIQAGTHQRMVWPVRNHLATMQLPVSRPALDKRVEFLVKQFANFDRRIMNRISLWVVTHGVGKHEFNIIDHIMEGIELSENASDCRLQVQRQTEDSILVRRHLLLQKVAFL